MTHTKAELRTWARGMDRSAASLAITDHLLGWPPLRGVVASYLAMPSEVSTTSLFVDREVTAAVPRIDEDGSLSMRRYVPNNLVPHNMGFLEPRADAPIVESHDIDIALVPGLAFDRGGGRLGRGKGYYDRFLAGLRRSTARIGVTTDETIVDEVPMDDHDVRMLWLATESGVRWVGATLSRETTRFMESAINVGIAPAIQTFPAGTRTSKSVPAGLCTDRIS